VSFDEQRARDEEREREFREQVERQREELRRARAAGDPDAELRERERVIDRMQRDHDRDRRRADRAREHEHRHEERRARHQARHEFRFGRGLGINVDVDPDEIARSVSAAFIGMDDDDDGESHDQTIEKKFVVEGMPRLRVQNVSGETAIRVGAPGEVRVVARKRVKGGSADRAKRLLENVEVRIEQRGNDIYVEPHLYEQERTWLDLFRGKRFRVDLEITVPRECAVNAQTVSGDLELSGTRGPARVESVSGDVNIADVQGPIRIKSVSGDVQATDYVGAVEGSSVSGDVEIHGRVRNCELHTVSGDISVDLEPESGGRESHLKTISGDVELGLLSSSCVCEFHTASGDLECDTAARIMREGRKDRRVIIGDGRGRLFVRTVSGDLTIKPASSSLEEEPVAAGAPAAPDGEPEGEVDPERTAPMAPPATAAVRDLLERLARGEVSVHEAAAKLDETRRAG
jgi:Putative adhesin